jgi:hypothetical protein
VHRRDTVTLVGSRPLGVEILYPDLGIEEPVGVMAERYGLDAGALLAAARSALAVPDPTVTIEVATVPA